MHFLSRRFLFLAFPLTLLLVALPGRAQSRDGDYRGLLRQIRDARARVAADSRDIYPLIQILQGEPYPRAIQEACRRQDDAALLELYQAKHAERWPRTVPGTPLLSYAAMSGDVISVRRLMARGADVTAANAEKWTALHYAAESGNVKIIRMLLDQGADVNAATARFSETPLMLACRWFSGGSSMVCARLLIVGGANVNAATNDGETALMFAARRGLIDAVKLLLSKNANASLEDAKGKTALSRVEAFRRIDGNGRIVFTQDSTTIPTYSLTVGEALIAHGKMAPGRYISPEAEKRAEAEGLRDFLRIARLLQRAEDKRSESE